MMYQITSASKNPKKLSGGATRRHSIFWGFDTIGCKYLTTVFSV